MGKNNKRNRSNNSTTGLTPPTKTIANMASPNQQQQQQSFSNLLNQAHETLYTSTPMNTCQRLPLAGPYQQNPMNNMNQTFDCINPVLNPQAPPILNSNTSPVSVPVPVLHPPGYQPLPSQSAPLPTLPTYPYPHDNARPNISMEMLVSTINIINQRLERIDVVVCEKLSKLDQKIDERFDKIEKSITNIYQEIENVKTTQKVHSEILDKEETHHHEIADRMTLLENYAQNIETEKNQIREDHLKMQTHTMKYNLIFGGIEQTALDYEEETEAVLKEFIKTELEIPDADQINFQNVHRLRKRNDGKPRNIIARFTHYKDHERVRKVVPVKLKEKTRYTVNQQYPTEIINRRQNLYPKMKELQRRGMRASLVYDQIFVNGRPYDETRVERPNPANARHS